jgi:hypothetical protein
MKRFLVDIAVAFGLALIVLGIAIGCPPRVAE